MRCEKIKRFMKKAKILTVLTVLLAMGLTACGGEKKSEEGPKSQPESQQSQGGESQAESQGGQSQGGDQSSQAPASSSEAPAGLFENVPDPDGHHFGAEEDVAADADLGTVAMKKAVCADGDNVLKYAVNQSVVTFASGSSNKSGTPDGYVKLSGNNQSLSFKVKMAKIFVGKLYFLGRMDGYSTESNQSVGIYRQGSPNIQIDIDGKKVDLSSKASYKYSDTFGTETVATDLESPSNYLSHEGYVEVCDVVLEAGAREFVYTRKASQNMIVRDFVLIGKEFDSEWADGQQVAAADGSIAYVKYANNLYPEMVKVEWAAIDGTLSEGATIKNGTPTGFVKLNSNTQSISYAFNFDENLDGQIYQHGAMDGWAGNANTNYFSQTKGAKYGNFEMKVNGSVVYYGNMRDTTYGDMLGSEIDESLVDSTNANNKYSYAKDCLIGDAFLKEGANTASYMRVDSYNLAISHFVFIGKKVAAAHVNPAADAAYAGQDDASHWQVAEGDSFKFNRGEHHWIADADETDTESTCTEHGQKHWKCEICGMKRVEELELAAHTWVSDPDLAATDTESTCTTHGVAHMLCSVCGAKEAQELPLGEHAFTEGTQSGALIPLTCSACNLEGYRLNVADAAASGFHAPGKMKSDATWDVTGIAAGTYDIQVFCYMDNNDNRAKQGFVNGTENRYQWKSDNGDYVSPSTGTKTYADVGVGKADKVYCWTSTVAQITIGENSTSFVMHWAGSGYSLYVSGVRLLKAAA